MITVLLCVSDLHIFTTYYRLFELYIISNYIILDKLLYFKFAFLSLPFFCLKELKDLLKESGLLIGSVRLCFQIFQQTANLLRDLQTEKYLIIIERQDVVVTIYLALVGQGLDVGVVIEHVLLSQTCQLANTVHQET